jgi:hypothetical protein
VLRASAETRNDGGLYHAMQGSVHLVEGDARCILLDLLNMNRVSETHV